MPHEVRAANASDVDIDHVANYLGLVSDEYAARVDTVIAELRALRKVADAAAALLSEWDETGFVDDAALRAALKAAGRA
jgi:hypothetical protein